MTIDGSSLAGPVQGVLRTDHGTLVLRLHPDGRIWAEVDGFITEDGQRLLERLSVLSDVVDEVCAWDDPAIAAELRGSLPRLHRRRWVVQRAAAQSLRPRTRP